MDSYWQKGLTRCQILEAEGWLFCYMHSFHIRELLFLFSLISCRTTSSMVLKWLLNFFVRVSFLQPIGIMPVTSATAASVTPLWSHVCSITVAFYCHNSGLLDVSSLVTLLNSPLKFNGFMNCTNIINWPSHLSRRS